MSEPIVTLHGSAIKDELKALVRQTVEEAINALLEEEANALAGAEHYERTAKRGAYRAGHYDRRLTATSGAVNTGMPKLKGARLATAIIERYRRGEVSVEEAIVGMYLAGVSTRRIEDAAEILWGSSVSAGTVSNLSERTFEAIEEWRTRPLGKECRYVCTDGTRLKRPWGGSFENAAAMIAIGVDDEGYREVIGCAEGYTESKECWAESLSRLREGGFVE